MDYEPRSVLLTGGAGFICANVLQLLVPKYPNIVFINLDSLEYCSCVGNVRNLEHFPNYRFIHGSILDSDMIMKILNDFQIDTIMHFAAQTHVCNSFGDSINFSLTNVLGTHTLLECAKNFGIRKFIHVSTDEVVGEDTVGIPMDENSKMNPSNPYAATKAGAELLVKSYHHSFNLPIVISRGNNVYGQFQYPEKMIPKFVNQLMNGKKLTIHGDGSSLRNFLHCSDVASAFEILLFKGVIGEIYNIGGSNEFTILDVARKILVEMSGYLEQVYDVQNTEDMLQFVEDRNFNDCRYHITSDKLKALGWEEKTSFEDGLKRTIEWYFDNIGVFGNIDEALVAHPKLLNRKE